MFFKELKRAVHRRSFLQGTGLSALAAGLPAFPQQQSSADVKPESIARAGEQRPLTEEEKYARVASNSYPIRSIFKTQSTTAANANTSAMKQKYGEITMMDFPDFTKKTFPGVYKMDLMSQLFGDVDDSAQFETGSRMLPDGTTRTSHRFDPSRPASKRWLDQFANKLAATGTQCQHISNDAVNDIADLDPAKRKAGIEMAKTWFDAAKTIGAKSMRINTGGPRLAPQAQSDGGLSKNDELVAYLDAAIDSYKQLAHYGDRVGVRVTLENHWGLTANPMHIRIIVEEVNSPFCEASPDFGNWEHRYYLYHALGILAPISHTTCHAKFWNRYPDMDVQRNVRTMLNGGYEGVFALEYEAGPWDGVEGAVYLYKQVLAAL